MAPTYQIVVTGGNVEIYPISYAPIVAPPNEDRVTETIEVLITGASYSALYDAVKSLNMSIDRAGKRDAFLDHSDVFLEFIPDGTTTEHYSKIYSAYMNFETGALTAALWTTNKTFRAWITIERDNYWMTKVTNVAHTAYFTPAGAGIGTASLPIRNTFNAAGGTTNNCFAFGTVGAFNVRLPDYYSDMNGFLQFSYTNTYATGSVSKLWVASTRDISWSGGVDYHMEAESATGASGTADATCSGGTKTVHSLTSDSETDLLVWAKSADWFSKYVHVMCRFANNTNLGDVKFRIQIRSGTTVIWSGDQFILSDPTMIIQDLGVIPMPPTTYLYGMTYNLALSAQRTSTGTKTISVDFVELFEADNFMELTGLVPAAQNDVITFGHYFNAAVGSPRASRALNYRTSGSSKYLDWISRGNKSIEYNPNTNDAANYQFFYFLAHSSTAGTAEIARTGTVSANLYLRRRSI
jgi:hypothetical protein